MKIVKTSMISGAYFLLVLLSFDHFFSWVDIDSFAAALLAALIISFTLQASIKVEGIMAEKLLKQKVLPLLKRAVSSYIILVGSKFLAMGLIAVALADRVIFAGPGGGVLIFLIIVFISMGLEYAIKNFASNETSYA
ncbi:hypothetical protein [Motilimonas eburnea]|uniref:hypothetical protein n=1 Tax=Motilimonas eburnea TaxID=1737488 RepID=UPI001E4DAFA8|nr:hypothetical protein [Motilimonas eburnea]MCE2570266.1 hypothetical protein [Motilimonas eburnea]